jgi:hypothetical protein
MAAVRLATLRGSLHWGTCNLQTLQLCYRASLHQTFAEAVNFLCHMPLFSYDPLQLKGMTPGESGGKFGTRYTRSKEVISRLT